MPEPKPINVEKTIEKLEAHWHSLLEIATALQSAGYPKTGGMLTQVTRNLDEVTTHLSDLHDGTEPESER